MLERSKRHVHFISELDLSRCYFLPEFDEYGDYGCRYVGETASCMHNWQLFNYLRILACNLHLRRTTGGTVAQLVLALPLLGVYFATIALLAKHFIAPNLLAVGRCLRATGYGFGATFVAALMSSGSVLDLATHCAHHTGRGSLLLARAFGKATCCYAVGMIQLSMPTAYRCAPIHTLISLLVLYFGILYVAKVFAYEEHLNKTHLYVHLTLTSSVYVAYLVYLVWCAWRQRGKKHTYIITYPTVKPPTQSSPAELTTVLSVSSTSSSSTSNRTSVACTNCLWLINPTHHIEPKLLAVILGPFWLCLCLLLPLMDERRPIAAWCKYLSPFWFPFGALLLSIYITQRTVTYILIGLGGICTLLTLLFTSGNKQPRFQCLYAFYGVLFGFIVFKALEIESTSLLFQLLSFLFNFSTDNIALLAYPLPYIVLALFMGMTMLQRGYADIVFGYVIGFPMCIPYFAFPLLTLQLCNHSFSTVNITANTHMSYAIYAIMLGATIIILPMVNFQLRRSFAFYLLVLCVVFVLSLVLSELEIIHPYGGMHAAIVEHVHHAEWA